MNKSMKDKLTKISKERKKLIQKRTEQLIAEEVILQNLSLGIKKTKDQT